MVVMVVRSASASISYRPYLPTIPTYRLERDGEEEQAALTFRGSDSDAAAVQLHDPLGDGQPQPRPRAPLQLARPDLHEALEQLGLVFLRDAWPTIPHGQQHHIVSLGTI